MYKIEITNEQSRLDLSIDWLETIVRETLRQEEVRRATISVAVVDNPTMRRLNRRHLQHDYNTDVLSFLLDSNPETPHGSIPRGRDRELEGEVIVSADMAADMASQFNWRAEDELCLYLVHGLLHLCGYDDLSEPEQVIMRQREKDVLSIWRLTPHHIDDSAAPVAGSIS